MTIKRFHLRKLDELMNNIGGSLREKLVSSLAFQKNEWIMLLMFFNNGRFVHDFLHENGRNESFKNGCYATKRRVKNLLYHDYQPNISASLCITPWNIFTKHIQNPGFGRQSRGYSFWEH